MDDSSRQRSNWVSSGSVQISQVPVLVGNTDSASGQPPVRVVPVLEDGIVKYLEIHCSCGNTTVLECVYDEENTQ